MVGDIYEWPADEDVFGETRTYTVQVDQVVLPFTDIEQDAYYYDALVWGYSNGIVLGTTETTFSPDENVTRAGHCVPVSSGRRAGVRREGTIYGCAVGCVLCTGFGLGGREQDRLRRFGNRF
ncbi:MAG: S-layer homology domain-containing protein [Clostridiales bacterium]|nr:S-layer homology domain-containing protein [Clostridiales bacterium]MDD6935707.1 S-layer homology domain-containing protein [Clostridiales bacterium]MDY2961960.1 S-layer homology domain-containing protein [Oscillospiraceae bacterium]